MSTLEARWTAAWEQARNLWSRFVQLSPPHFCTTVDEERREGLLGSFAMIRLTDHAVVISLRQVEEQGLQHLALPILAHEIGHHVYAPGDLVDQARILARIRRALPGLERQAPMVANLYTDLLINDRLQRELGVEVAEVYRRLEERRKSPASELWQLYLRGYELLWNLPRGSLIATPKEATFQADAGLVARIIRVYARDWVRGSARFAVLLRPYLEKMAAAGELSWLDALQAGSCELPPAGLGEEEEDEAEAGLHPVEDPKIAGAAATPPKEASKADHRRPRNPRDYTELMGSLGVRLPPEELIARYYREHSSPYLVPFPVREQKRSTDPLPEGLDLWDPSSPLAELDWVESLVRSPVVIPGVTTVERRYGHTEGQRPEKLPLDLYLGIDCSGSMPNPSYVFSFPVLAGAVILRSGLRVGARVQVTLSGEPGSWTSTKAFIRDEAAAMRVLTGYLGTGYAFGILRLKETFLDQPPPKRPVHILLISDSDLFAMCRSVPEGWALMGQVLRAAGGGGTVALNAAPKSYATEVEQLRTLGWMIEYVPTLPDLLGFARRFSNIKYGIKNEP
jgi:hypothetical protein